MASSKTVTVGRVEALEGRVGSNEEEVAALKERVIALEERLVAMEAVGVKKGVAKKERVKKEKVKVAAPLPEAAEGAPDASAYRISAEEIEEGVCVGRLFDQPDKRWSPAIYAETQCGGELADGEELCATCSRRQAKYAEAPKPGPWLGRLDEEPLEWCHMLGTEWAEERKPRWRPQGEGASDSASEVSSVSAGGSKPGRKPAKSAEEKEAEKAAKAATAAAEKAAAKAAKEAEKAAAKAAKAATAAAEKAAKDAEKVAKKKVEKAEKPATAKKVAVAAAAAETAVATAAFSIKMIDGEFYAICGSDVFEYDSMLEEKGSLVGHMEGETFVPLAAAEEADADAE
jgi:hypothetical protein